ncbi:hypothetical protein ASG22_15935 [Chryseobacterium sp. Leaf405]|uniref:hypothetical protein n=1 Tax=Chryseobacterium sp. Leaf405 TaxID=1736367 RepID=UPI0006F7BF0E|nr:hypothetical protein [Chryseobacterium sp. Leaf405]KQT21643.1 hypothetical protein ASG22_15935 [Chryseobacterium sp. Leaf405]
MKTLILPFLFLLTFVISCKTDDMEALEKKTNSYDVYVAGMENYKACYWKNNVKTNLFSPDSTTANKIIVENNDVHVLGKNRNNFNGSYYHWKNNVREDLGQYLGIPSFAQYQILDMAIDNNDNYFIGYYDTSSPIANQRYAFCIWKNGVKTVLNTYGDIIYTTSKLNIFNHQPYISAIIYDGASFQSGYYVNSTFHSVPDISWVANFSENTNGINFLYIKNQNYYYRQLSTNTEVLVDSNVSPNLAYGKIVSEANSSDLYVIGSPYLNNYYYKNNIQTTVPLDPNYSTIQDMFVLDNNIYIIKQQPTSSFASKVYINNIETQSITNTTNLFGNAFNSIYVTQH